MAYDPQICEQEVLAFWAKNEIYKKLKERNAGRQSFYYLDGPPYTSGRIHLGHAWGRALRDAQLRFKRMMGFDVWDRAGFDMHGLPTEHAAEKKLGIRGKEAIEGMGLANFMKACKELSIENMNLMIADFKRLGIWMDYDNPYMPINNEYIEGVWWLVKKAHEKGRLYRGLRTMAWDCANRTAVAKHELEYKMLRDQSVYLKFELKESPKTFFLIWTTTPWTIPFNMAVMVNPEVTYAHCKVGDEVWIIAEDLVEHFFTEVVEEPYEIVKKCTGQELDGIAYTHPFTNDIPYFSELNNDKLHTVLLSKEYVDTSAGTGLVHCAPGCGPEDYEVGHRNGLPPFNFVREDGVFERMGVFSDLRAKKDDKEFVSAFEKQGCLVASKTYEHEYPHDWRSHDPVIFRTTKQWFFKIEDIREKLKEVNKNITWVPEWAGKNQFHSWLDNLRDNSISKQRYWGTPLPIWVNEENPDDYIVIGSADDLKSFHVDVPEDLHKPWIDDVVIEKDGKTYKRVPDVIDVWVDAGSASWLCLDFPRKKENFNHFFPADFILEGKDQIRGWFNMLLIASMIAHETPSYKSVYMHGFINDAKGRKMSKSLGNYIRPSEVIDKYGADAWRYYSIGAAQPGLDMNYNFNDVQVKYRNLIVFWNIHSLLLEALQNVSMQEIRNNPPALGIEEKYMLAVAETIVEQVTAAYNEMRISDIPELSEKVFLELSRTYVQFVRDKLALGDKAAVYTLAEVFVCALKLMSPLTPFVTDAMWQRLKGPLALKEESVHHTLWQKPNASWKNDALITSVERVQTIIAAGMHGREKMKRSVRWPLQAIHIVTRDKELQESTTALKELIKRQLNVLSVFVTDRLEGTGHRVRPVHKTIGRTFGKRSKDILRALESSNGNELHALLQKKGYVSFNIEGEEVQLNAEHITFEETVPDHFESIPLKEGFVFLEKEITPELETEGLAREVMRRVQLLRKKAGLHKKDRIDLVIQANAATQQMLRSWKDCIAQKVGCVSIHVQSSGPLSKKHTSEEKIKEFSVTIGFDKIE